MVLHLRVPRTQNPHYPAAHCLRDLVGKICIVDPCHKFTCYLDDCIHELFVNSKRVQELCRFLDGVKESGTCKELVGQETLPKDSPSSGCWCLARRRGTSMARFLGSWRRRWSSSPCSCPCWGPSWWTSTPSTWIRGSWQRGKPQSWTQTCFQSVHQVPAGAVPGLQGGAMLPAAHHQAEEQELISLSAPGLMEAFSDLAFGDCFLHLLTGHLVHCWPSSLP